MRSGFTEIRWYPDHLLRFIARLAEVDGAAVLTPDLCVLGFGAKISVQPIPVVYELEPKAGILEPIQIPIGDAGGTRHQSAIRFVGENRKSVAIIISQDGHISVAHYSPSPEGVLLLRNTEWWS